MRSTECVSGSYYFDPNTGKCHPCADCGPGRSPMKICLDQCKERIQDETVANVDNPGPHRGVPPTDYGYLALAISTGVLMILVLLLVVVFLICKWHRHNNGGQHQTSNHAMVVQVQHNNNNIEAFHPTCPAVSQPAADVIANDDDIDTNILQYQPSTDLPSGSYMTRNRPIDSHLLQNCGDSYLVGNTGSHFIHDYCNGHQSGTAPLIERRANDMHQSSLQTTMDRPLLMGNGVGQDSTPLLPQRHVCFAAKVECLEFSNDSGSCQDVCMLSECRNVGVVVTPQQNDSSYHLTPSFHVIPTNVNFHSSNTDDH